MLLFNEYRKHIRGLENVQSLDKALADIRPFQRQLSFLKTGYSVIIYSRFLSRFPRSMNERRYLRGVSIPTTCLGGTQNEVGNYVCVQESYTEDLFGCPTDIWNGCDSPFGICCFLLLITFTVTLEPGNQVANWSCTGSLFCLV